MLMSDDEFVLADGLNISTHTADISYLNTHI